MSDHKNIAKTGATVSALIVVSRLTGFVRDVLIAGVFGTGAAAQAFFIAFKIPNMFRDILGEGAGSAAFVPVFSEYLARRGREDFLRLARAFLAVVLGLVAGVTLLGVCLAHPIVRLMAPGFFGEPAKFSMTVGLTRLVFPYLILISLSAYFMSVSNVMKSFALPAASSIAFNVVLVAVVFSLSVFRNGAAPSVAWLGAGVLLAGCVQLFVQYLPLKKQGVDFTLRAPVAEAAQLEALGKVGRLILPRLVGTSVYQLNIFVDTIFASFVSWTGEGAVAAIYYANRIIQLPLAVFGVAFSNAALPAMSAYSAKAELDRLKSTLSFLMKILALTTAPVCVFLLIFAAPVVRLIFERGVFDAYSTSITSQAVFFYALGLISYGGVRFLSTGFYALQDTATPVKGSSLALAANILMNAFFVFGLRWGLAGLALASSLSATLNFVFLYARLKGKIGFVLEEAFWRMSRKAAFAASAAAVFVWILSRGYPALLLSGVWFFCLMIFGVAAYVGLLWAGRVEEVRGLLSWLRNRRSTL